MEGQRTNGEDGEIDDFDTIERFLNQIFTRMNVSTLNPSLIDNVMDQSFQEQTVQQFAAAEEFIQGLEKVKIKEGDVYSCGICLEDFKVGETVLKLPCKDTPHYFHFKEENKDKDEQCDGILPWLKIKNSCPICRCEFPEGEAICLEATTPPHTNDEQTTSLETLEMNNSLSFPFMMGTNPFQSPIDLTGGQIVDLQQDPIPNENLPDGESAPLEQGIFQREIRPRMIEVNLSTMVRHSVNTILEEREERMMQEVLYQSFIEQSHSNDNETNENETNENTSENQ
jgi:hypothetical protein